MTIEANSVGDTFERLRERLGSLVPTFELLCKAELVFKINQLKRQQGAVILGHNYMEPALYHGVADHVGDSLELSRIAAHSGARTIVFCGVRFMAETAKILSPDKTVLLPSMEAGCSLAASITAADVRRLRERYPGVPVVSYVNTYADVKAESDACCTSSNAAAVVESFNSKSVIFLPDEYLAGNVARETGRHIIFPVAEPPEATGADANLEYAVIGWRGRCEVHERFTVEDVRQAREAYPDVVVLAHPECSPAVVAAADHSGSTSSMIRHVHSSAARRFLLLTECSMGDNICAENPGKEMLRLCSVRCPHMQSITLQDTLASLERNIHVIDVAADIARRAKSALDYMLRIGASTPTDVRPGAPIVADQPAIRGITSS